MPINWFLMSSVPRPQMKPSTILPSNGGWVQLSRIGGNHVLVSHQHDRLQVGPAALPGVEQAVAVDDLALQLLVHQRVGLLQHPVKLLERLRVGRALVVQGDRLAAHRGGQVLGHGLSIDWRPFRRLDGTLTPREHRVRTTTNSVVKIRRARTK